MLQCYSSYLILVLFPKSKKFNSAKSWFRAFFLNQKSKGNVKLNTTQLKLLSGNKKYDLNFYDQFIALLIAFLIILIANNKASPKVNKFRASLSTK